MAKTQSDEDTVAMRIEPVSDSTGDFQEDGITTDESIAEKEHFRKIAEEDSFSVNERYLPPGYAQRLKKDKKFWYADAEFKKKEKKNFNGNDNAGEYVPLGQRSWVQALVWLLIIGGFAGAIMWYLAESNVGLFRKKQVPASAQAATDDMPEDIFAINYQREIDKATAKGDYRLAVRMMFLRLLKELSDKKIIQYQQDRTNLDYLLQVHSTPHYRPFFRLTRHFEYSWYGHFEVEEDAYKVIASEFDQFDHEIRNS